MARQHGEDGESRRRDRPAAGVPGDVALVKCVYMRARVPDVYVNCQAADLYAYIDPVVAFLVSSYVFWWCNNRRSQAPYIYIIKVCLLSIEKKGPSAFGPESMYCFFPQGIRSMFICGQEVLLRFNNNHQLCVECYASSLLFCYLCVSWCAKSTWEWVILLGAYTNCLVLVETLNFLYIRAVSLLPSNKRTQY